MSRARDLANGITTLAPLASPDFTGSVDVAGEITSTVSGGSNAVFDKSTGGSIAFKQGGTSTSLIEDLQSSGGIGFYTGTGGSLTKKVEINSSGSITTPNGGSFNGTIGSDALMASSGLTVRNIEQVALSSDATLNNNTTLTTFFSPTYTNKFSGSKVVGILTYMGQFDGTTEGRHKLRIDFSGSNITNYNTRDGSTLGGYNYGNERILRYYYASIFGGLMTTDSIAVITADCKHQMQGSGSSAYAWTYFGNNTAEETFFTWIEYK